MAKNKKVATANDNKQNENPEIEESDEILQVKSKKQLKEEKKQAKLDEKNALAKKQAKQKKSKNEKPKRHRIKETISELKKVSWPSFKTTCKQTGAVLVVVIIFMLVILGVDSLVSWIIDLIVNI